MLDENKKPVAERDRELRHRQYTGRVLADRRHRAHRRERRRQRDHARGQPGRRRRRHRHRHRNVAGTTITGTSNYAVGATTLTFGTLSATPASIQAYGSTMLSVDVLAGAGKYTDQPVNVSFSSACVTAGKATLATTVPTNNGTAQTVYRDKGCASNDTITVSADGVAKSAPTTLAIAPPSAASVQFVARAPSDQSIVIQGQGGNGRTETATLTFKVVDIFGNPLAGKQVNFTPAPAPSRSTRPATPPTPAAAWSPPSTRARPPTSFRVLATLPDTGANGNADISTMSDSVVVTTGLPVQRAFSISAGSFNVEGWNIDSTPSTPATTVQVLLADTFGNPVPDGTPIVFQTNMGAVGSSDKGGCNTVNGGCSVEFRAQNPRMPSPGTAGDAVQHRQRTGEPGQHPRRPGHDLRQLDRRHQHRVRARPRCSSAAAR